jgi:hypothetical protein
MEDFNENTKNLYVVRRRLAELTKHPGGSCFYYYIGNFILKIFTDRVQEHSVYDPEDRITKHEVVDISLVEVKRFIGGQGATTEECVYLEHDSRFKNYTPIKYSEWAGYSAGREMPINHLCELVKYLHRLSNLSAFM